MNLKTIFQLTQTTQTSTTNIVIEAHPSFWKRMILGWAMGVIHRIVTSLGNEEITVAFYRFATILENTSVIPTFIVSADKNLRKILRQEGS